MISDLTRAIHSRRLALAGAIFVAGGAAIGMAALQSPEAAHAADARYHFVGAPVLTYSRKTYTVVFRLDHDVPRLTNRRARVLLKLQDATALSVHGGTTRQVCFSAGLENVLDSPGFGHLYKLSLEIPGAPTLTKRVRLQHATAHHGAFYGNQTSDPKVRALHCGPR